MKRRSVTLVVVVAGLVGLGYWLRTEMARHREKVREEIRREITEAPANIVRGVADAANKAATDAGGSREGPPSVAGNTATTPSSTRTNPTVADALAGLFDVAVKTAQQVDRVGLELTRLTDEQESKLGAEIDRMILADTPVVSDAALQRRVQSLARPLIEQRQRRAITYTVRVLDSEDVNASSVAGGYVYVTRAFLKQFPTDAALVMALAHEIGHVDLRHCVEQIQYRAAARQFVGDLAELAQIGYATARSAYTKDQEFAADEYGFAAARKAGWAAADLVQFYRDLDFYERGQRVNRKGDAGPDEKPPELVTRLAEYLRTHPATRERLARLETLSRQ
jgi:beta-barrel assembly-enhancing protease